MRFRVLFVIAAMFALMMAGFAAPATDAGSNQTATVLPTIETAEAHVYYTCRLSHWHGSYYVLRRGSFTMYGITYVTHDHLLHGTSWTDRRTTACR